MLKQISFILGCSKRHMGLYASAFIAMIGIFLMYLINVNIQNYDYEHTTKEVESGLAHSTYQQIVLYVLNGLAILYFVVHVYKGPKLEGYELILSSKKTSRLNIMFSRLTVSLIFVFVLCSFEALLLLAPVKTDIVMPQGDPEKWLASTYIGMLISGMIMLCIFVFIVSIFGYVSSIILNTLLVVSFPLVSIAIYSTNSANTDKLDRYDTNNYGFYTDQRLTEDNVMPIVENGQLVFPNLHFKRVNKKIVNLNSYQDNATSFEILQADFQEYNSKSTYGKYVKGDSWNAFKNYFNIFNKSKYYNNHTHRIYKRYNTTEVNDFYEGIPTNAFIRYRGGTDLIEVVKNLDSNHTLRKEFKYMTKNFVRKDTQFVQKLIRDAIALLESDDEAALKYSETTGNIFWRKLLNEYDPSEQTIKDFLINGDFAVYQTMGIEENFAKIPNYISGFFLDKMMKTKNPARYQLDNYGWVEDHSGFKEEKASILSIKNAGWNMYPLSQEGLHSNAQPAITLEEREYDSKTPWTIILPILAAALFAASIVIFIKKDIK